MPPNSFEEDFKLGRALFVSHKYSAAYNQFIKLNRQYPSNAFIIAQLARCAWMMGLNGLSKSYAKKALQLNPDIAEAWVILGNNIKDDYLAEIYYRKALRLNPTYEVAWVNIGNIYYRNRNYSSAKIYYDSALSFAPNYEYALMNLGLIHMRKMQYDFAKFYFYRVINLWPEYPNAWYQLGLLYRSIGDPMSAEVYFRKTLTLNPSFLDARENLIEIYRNEPFYAELFHDFDLKVIVNSAVEMDPSLRIILFFIEQGHIPNNIVHYPWLIRYFDIISKKCQKFQLNSLAEYSEIENIIWQHSMVPISPKYNILL